ncbi:MAG: glycine betaine ABC transporter substrate-binding protein, partial [Planctomycetota bacterium]
MRPAPAAAGLLAALLLGVLLLEGCTADNAPRRIAVGSKHFTESYILAEIIAQLLEDRGFPVERRFGLGGTKICFDDLTQGDLDLYPEYSGTLAQAILKLDERVSYDELGRLLKEGWNLDLLPSFGFNNTYAIAVSRSLAERLGLKRVSELPRHPRLRYGFSHEFLERKDGWPGLAETYRLQATPVGIEHGLAYRAIEIGDLDVTDVYSTDGDIRKHDLLLLEDDRAYFPRYLAAPIVRGGLEARVGEILRELAGILTESEMQALNARAEIEGESFEEIARGFLEERRLVASGGRARGPGRWSLLLRRTGEHLLLTFSALLGGILVAIPLGILIYRRRRLARPALYITGLLQTIPSIALLAFMIPYLGTGYEPAVAALFLYSLLPILRNTASALFSIDPVLKKVALGMGLTVAQRLRHVELPLAAPTILAGVRTAAVINIGTATLAAMMVVFNVNSVSFMPAFGLASAGAILCGQAIGRGEPD